MNEGCGDISLDGLETKDAREDEHDANRGPLNNRGPCFEEVNTLFLTVTASTESSFELFDTAIRESFAFECPCGRKDIHLGSSRD